MFLKGLETFKMYAPDGDGAGSGGTDNSGANNGGGTPPKTYSEEEYNKLKASFDKTSSELADAKKKINSNLSEDEKKAKEYEELNNRLAESQSKLEDYDLKEELLKNGVFTSDEANSIIKLKGDKKAMLNKAVELFNAKIENAKKEAVAEFMRKSDVGGVQNKNTDDAQTKEIKEMAASHKGNNGKSKFF